MSEHVALMLWFVVVCTQPQIPTWILVHGALTGLLVDCRAPVSIFVPIFVSIDTTKLGSKL